MTTMLRAGLHRGQAPLPPSLHLAKWWSLAYFLVYWRLQVKLESKWTTTHKKPVRVSGGTSHSQARPPVAPPEPGTLCRPRPRCNRRQLEMAAVQLARGGNVSRDARLEGNRDAVCQRLAH